MQTQLYRLCSYTKTTETINIFLKNSPGNIGLLRSFSFTWLENFFSDISNFHFFQIKYVFLALFLNYKNGRVVFIFQNGWALNVSCYWFVWLDFGISSFFKIFEKKLFKGSAVLDSNLSVFWFSVRFMFCLLTCQKANVLLFSKISYYL